jgi:site-specific recombinase XerD
MKAKYRFIFNRKNKLNKKGLGLIQIEVYLTRTDKKYISTKLYVAPNQWDNKTGLINNKHDNFIKLNSYLKSIVKKIEDYELQLINKGENLTFYLLENFLSADPSDTINDFINNELEKGPGQLSSGTYIHMKSFYKTLNSFNSNIRYQDISFDLINEFNRFLINKKLKTNTIAKQHSLFRKFINLAIMKDILSVEKNPYRKFKIKTSSSGRNSLTFSELAKIEELNYSEKYHMHKIRDMFLFCCYTGLRFSDGIYLREEAISKTDQGYIVEVIMKKIEKPVYLPCYTLFEGKPDKIIAKYINNDTPYLFGNKITNQYFNRELKTIEHDAKLTMKLTSHIARHTFGTLLAEIKPDPYLVMDLMGHSNLKTSMIYIHNSRDRVNRQLEGLNWNK